MSGFSWDVLLPWLYWPLAGYLLGWLALALSARVAFGRPVREGAHWTERARLTFPGAKWSNTGPIVVTVLLLALWRDDLFDGALAGRLLGACVGLASFIGCLQAGAAVSSRRRIPVTLGEALRTFFLSLLFFVPALLPGLAAVVYLGWSGGAASLWPALGGAAAVVLLLCFGGSYRLAHLLGLVEPPDPRTLLVLQEAARRAGGRMPESCGILRWRSVNALAFPFSRAVLLTRGALEQMDDEELVLISLHELAHLSEPRAVTALRVLGGLLLLPLMLVAPLVERYSYWGFLVPFLLLVVGGRLLRRLVHRMEQRADAAARTGQEQDGAYARMLEKLHRLNLIPAVLGPRDSAHPSLYDRMVATGQPPFYPRPFPPSRSRVFWTLVLTAALVALAAQLAPLGLDQLRALSYDQPPVEEWVEPQAPAEAEPDPQPPAAAPDGDTVSPAEFDRILKQIR